MESPEDEVVFIVDDGVFQKRSCFRNALPRKMIERERRGKGKRGEGGCGDG